MKKILIPSCSYCPLKKVCIILDEENEANRFCYFYGLSKNKNYPDNCPLLDEEIKKEDKILEQQIINCGLSIRTENILRNHDIMFVKDIFKFTEKEFLRFKQCGRRSMNELKEFFRDHKLTPKGWIL